MSIISFLVTFIVWSGMINLFVHLARRKQWGISTSPEFYLICIGASFLPLFPLPTFNQAIRLPEILQVASHFSGAVEIAQTKVVEVTGLEVKFLEYSIISLAVILSVKGMISFCIGLLRARAIVFQSKPINLNCLFTDKQQQLIERYSVKLRVTNEKVSPFSFGLFHTYLVLPEFIFTLPNSQQILIVEHELNHIQRQEHRLIILVKFISNLLSFNIILKRLECHYINAMELRCDTAVLEGASDIYVRKNYAQAILACLKHCVGINRQLEATHFSDPETGINFYHTRLKTIMGQNAMTNYSKQLLLTSFSIFLVGVSVNVVSANFSETVNENSQDWQLPLKKITVTSPFGHVHPIRNKVSHGGIDLKAEVGTPIYSVKAGVVTVADSTSLPKNYGKVVVVQHAGGYFSVYAHLDGFAVSENDEVLAGQKLGFAGVTGKSTGPHLHFELLKGELRVDPAEYFPF